MRVTGRAMCLAAAAMAAMVPMAAVAQAGPYKVLDTKKVGGEGGVCYGNSDSVGRRLYVARSGMPGGRVTVFNLDTLASVGEIPETSAHGVVIDVKLGH